MYLLANRREKLRRKKLGKFGRALEDLPIFAVIIGRMATDQLHPGTSRVGTFGQGPMPYSSLFGLLFVAVLVIGFLVTAKW